MPVIPALGLGLETVTPLFVAGALPDQEAELRAPSFRGALRYWLRAALGGSHGGDLAEVHRREAGVFGSTDAESGGGSAVVVRLLHGEPDNFKDYEKHGTVIVKKAGKELKQPTGQDYLYWSMPASGSVARGNLKPARKYYPPGTQIDLVLSARPGVSNGSTALEEAASALWLLLHLGGIGSRSRRTAGSLVVRAPASAAGLDFQLHSATTSGAAAELSAGLKAVREHFGAGSSGAIAGGGRPDFDILHPDHCRIWVLDAWKTWDAAVEAIGAAMRDYRTYTEPDHANVAKWLTGKTIPTVERAAFGLPLPFRYTDGPSGVVQGRRSDPAIDRRASPLWLKVTKTSSGAHVGVATLFESAFLPHQEKLYATTRTAGPPLPPPADYELVEQWIPWGFKAAQEVKYD